MHSLRVDTQLIGDGEARQLWPEVLESGALAARYYCMPSGFRANFIGPCQLLLRIPSFGSQCERRIRKPTKGLGVRVFEAGEAFTDHFQVQVRLSY